MQTKKSLVGQKAAQAQVAEQPKAADGGGNGHSTSLVPSNLQKYFSPVPTNTEPVVESGGCAGFLSEYWATSKGAKELLKEFPTINEGDWYVNSNGQNHLLGKTFNCHVIDVKQFWTARNPSFELMAASKTDPGRDDIKARQDECVAFLLVDVEGKLIPVTGTFRKANSPAAKTGLTEMQQAATPEWVAASESNKLAASLCVFPWGRFVMEVKTALRAARGSGRNYPTSHGYPRPINADDYQRLKTFLANGGEGLMSDVAKDFEMKVKNIEERCD